MDISRLGTDAQFGQINRVSSQAQGKKSNEKKAAASGSLFDKYLNAKPAENFTSHVKVGYEHGSPLCQMMDDYRAWKQDRQDAALPGIDSSEDEKISYLREHYSDASDGLSLFDALTAMKDMGMISQVEYSYATGGPLIRVSKEEMESGSFSTSSGERDERTYWGGACKHFACIFLIGGVLMFLCLARATSRSRGYRHGESFTARRRPSASRGKLVATA